MVVSLCFLQVFPQAARRFRPPVPQVDPEMQAAIEAAKEAQQAAAKANGGLMWSILDPTWWKNIKTKTLWLRSPQFMALGYIPLISSIPMYPGAMALSITGIQGTAMQNIEISQLFPRQTYVSTAV